RAGRRARAAAGPRRAARTRRARASVRRWRRPPSRRTPRPSRSSGRQSGSPSAPPRAERPARAPAAHPDRIDLAERLREDAGLRRDLGDELLLVPDEGDDRQAPELRDVAFRRPGDVADRQRLVPELLELRDHLRPARRLGPLDRLLEGVDGAVAVERLLAERRILLELRLVRRVDGRAKLVRVASRGDAARDDVEVLQVRHRPEPERAVEAGATDDRQVDPSGTDLLRRRSAARRVGAHEDEVDLLLVDELLHLRDLARDRLVAVHEGVLAGDLAAELAPRVLEVLEERLRVADARILEDVRMAPALAPGPGRPDRSLATGRKLIEEAPADSLEPETRVAGDGDRRDVLRARGSSGWSAEVVVESRDHQVGLLRQQGLGDASDQPQVGLRVGADDPERAPEDPAPAVDLRDRDLGAGEVRLVVEADHACEGERHRDHDRLLPRERVLRGGGAATG